MAGQLALTVSSCAVIRDRLARGASSLFPEYCKRFSFDKKVWVWVGVGVGVDVGTSVRFVLTKLP